ncbi:MAG: bifunctional DNA-formamidopyrimidine glycosylase/DNA-(apurinic or apyrimidinic site) lyase [Deltaproteobacteria bacterium]|nr:bifunctional DNA-formamidopyrimidine glycosylase/DNA-(apurinic or apyrimidinic site) lyase [Deltaproteobacteria bacterium]
MPELPEVETVVRSLSPLLRERTIESVWTSGLPLHMQKQVDEAALRRLLRAGRIKAIRRRGKYILIDVHGAKTEAVALVHLGMSGKLRVSKREEPRHIHTHVVLSLSGADELRFIDPRRFGQFKVATKEGDLTELAGMGPEPLQDLTEEVLRDSLATSRAPIKSFLLDQRRVAGLGNIYVSEALFEAKIHPATQACKLKRHATTLLQAVQLVLNRGLENRGTTLRDYVDGTGFAGSNQFSLKVYGREGEACLRCGAKVHRRVDAGRSTFFCASCQKRR